MTTQEQPTQPIPIISAKPVQETPQQRFQRLKRIADLTGKRLLYVYLEDERRRRQMEHRR